MAERKGHLDHLEAPLLLCVVVYTKNSECQYNLHTNFEKKFQGRILYKISSNKG